MAHWLKELWEWVLFRLFFHRSKRGGILATAGVPPLDQIAISLALEKQRKEIVRVAAGRVARIQVSNVFGSRVYAEVGGVAVSVKVEEHFTVCFYVPFGSTVLLRCRDEIGHWEWNGQADEEVKAVKVVMSV